RRSSSLTTDLLLLSRPAALPSSNGRPLSFRPQFARLVPVRALFRWLTRHNVLLSTPAARARSPDSRAGRSGASATETAPAQAPRSEEHTSELQSRENPVCRHLLA